MIINNHLRAPGLELKKTTIYNAVIKKDIKAKCKRVGYPKTYVFKTLEDRIIDSRNIGNLFPANIRPG